MGVVGTVGGLTFRDLEKEKESGKEIRRRRQ